MVSDARQKIRRLVGDHETRRRRTLNLVASENVLSPDARALLGTDLAHRYTIPPTDRRPPEIWDYPNQEGPRELQAIAEDLARTLFGGAVADVRPLSGNNAATILLGAAVDRGSVVAAVPADCGGHFATAANCAQFGLRLLDLPYDRSTGTVDAQRAAAMCRAEGVGLVFLDASVHLFPHPVTELREALPAATTLVYDASHTMGLIAGGAFQAPLAEGADALQGSTHKSLFGPQKGLFVFREHGRLADRVSAGVCPTFVSNTHAHHVAALAMALAEAAVIGPAYARQVVGNAKTLAAALHAGAADVLFPERGFTESHQVVVALGDRPAAALCFARLEAAGLHTNLVRVPYRAQGYGLRLGTAELTRRGMGTAEMLEVARMVLQVVDDVQPPDMVSVAVAELSAAFSSVAFTFEGS